MAQDEIEPGEDRSPDAMTRWEGALPLVCLVLALALFFAAGGERWLSLAAIVPHQEALSAWVAARPVLAPLVCLALGIACAAVSVPAGPLLAILAGFLFGPWVGTALHVAGMTGGACVLAAAARGPLRHVIARKSGDGGQRLLAWIRTHGFTVILSLRLMPVLPPPLASLVAAAAGVRLPTLAGATALAVLASSLPFVLVGAGMPTDLVTPSAPEGYALAWPALAGLTLSGLGILAFAVLRRRAAS